MSRATILPAASAGASRERVIVDHDRAKSDWYVDPPFCAEKLFEAIRFDGTICDPCCGSGTISKVASSQWNYDVAASDLVYRGYGVGECDFFDSYGSVDNFVFNPPYLVAEKFILHALSLAHRKVAALVNLKFLASQGRRERLFKLYPPAHVLILSRRPSMPPGGMGMKAKGGTADYCWIVWDNECEDSTTIGWLA